MLAYRPDDDPYTEGIFYSVSNVVPTNRGGYRNVYDSADLGYTTVAATSIGCAFIRRLDGSVRVFSGSATNIVEADQTTSGTGQWVDVSRTTAYTTAGSWTFAQYGDVSLAASYENTLQASNGAVGTKFSDVSGAPRAKIVYTLNKRVILLNTAGYTGSGQDGWAASSEGDYFTSTLWPPAATNNAAYGTLNEVGGPITAGCALGSLAIAWKRSGMWIGQDQGPPVQIAWQKIPGDFGCVGLRAWCAIDGGIFFVSPQDMYIFDGSRPRSITDGIKNTFFALYGADLAAGNVECVHDDVNNTVEVFLRTSQVKWIFNYKTLQWGRALGYRGTASETIDTALAASRAALYSTNGFSAIQSSNSSVIVMAGRRLRALGTGSMRAGTSASFTFNWFNANDGELYYKGLVYRGTSVPFLSLTGFAEGILSNVGPLTANTQFPRMDAKWSAIFLAPRLVVTNAGSDSFEFTSFQHNIEKRARA